MIESTLWTENGLVIFFSFLCCAPKCSFKTGLPLKMMDVNESRVQRSIMYGNFYTAPPMYSFKTTFENDGNLSLDIATRHINGH